MIRATLLVLLSFLCGGITPPVGAQDRVPGMPEEQAQAVCTFEANMAAGAAAAFLSEHGSPEAIHQLAGGVEDTVVLKRFLHNLDFVTKRQLTDPFRAFHNRYRACMGPNEMMPPGRSPFRNYHEEGPF